MLEEKDLQAIKELIDTSITASENRTNTYVKELIDASENRTHAYVKELIDASENRTHAYAKELIDASENRTHAYVKELIDASENRTHAYIEGAVIPQLQLLAEGHQALLETLAPKNRVEALEDEVVFMKSVIRSLAQDVAEQKKAQ